MTRAIYKITITQTRLEETIKPRSWEKGASIENAEGYGYAPEVIETKNVERELYTQSVAELDIKAVIKAVNKMELCDK